MGNARAVGLAVAMLASVAHADPTQLVAKASPTAPESSMSGKLGLIAGVGLPDGGTLGLAWRPVRPLRLEASFAHNYISPGYRAGATYIMLASWATPTLGIGYGHFYDRDANPAVRSITGDATFDSVMLDRVGYDYADARIGLELGRKHFTFFLHVGVTRLTAQIHDVAAASNTAAQQSGSMVTVTSTDPNVRLWAPTVDLGFVVYLL
ncbi:MAG TPA: hypothetical protein VGG28_16640 [Kofleriaceae bacterium]|jgi:hypothetical protein